MSSTTSQIKEITFLSQKLAVGNPLGLKTMIVSLLSPTKTLLALKNRASVDSLSAMALPHKGTPPAFKQHVCLQLLACLSFYVVAPQQQLIIQH
jgi:hypothetical protein